MRKIMPLLFAFVFLIPAVRATEGALPGINLLGIESMPIKTLFITAGISMLGMLILANLCCKKAEEIGAKVGPAVGIVVLAISSSIPLLAVAVTSAIAGSPELSITNVVATNIANLSIVLGLLAILKPFETRHGLLKGGLALLVLLFGALAITMNITIFSDGFAPSISQAAEKIITTQEGILILISFFAFVFILRFIKAEAAVPRGGTLLSDSILSLVFGIAVCYCANAAVLSIIRIAQHYAIPEAIIGSTIVVVGTSFPEFSVALAAMISKKEQLIYANLVTSSAVNFALGIGLASLFATMLIAPMMSSFFFPFMILGHIATLLLVLKGKLTRIHGIILIAIYLIYVYLLSIGGITILP